MTYRLSQLNQLMGLSGAFANTRCQCSSNSGPRISRSRAEGRSLMPASMPLHLVSPPLREVRRESDYLDAMRPEPSFSHCVDHSVGDVSVAHPGVIASSAGVLSISPGSLRTIPSSVSALSSAIYGTCIT